MPSTLAQPVPPRTAERARIQPAGATPDRTTTCDTCHTGAASGTVTATPSNASPSPGATYTVTRSDNDLVKTSSVNGNFNVAYNLKDHIKWLIDPRVALRGSYLRQKDENNHVTDRDEFLLFLVLSTTIPFSF